MTFAIFGAAGAVGRALAPELAMRNAQFRVVGRNEARLRQAFESSQLRVEIVPADLGDPTAVRSAAAGTETLFYLAGVPYNHFELHPRLTSIALEAAASSGVRHFLLVSPVYSYGKPEHNPVDESHSRNPSTFKGRMRKEQEDLVFAADNKNGMRTTILRAPDFYGPTADLSYAKAIFDAALKGGAANVIGPVDTPHEFIFVPDVACALVQLAGRPEAFGQAWNIAGPAPVSTRRFAEMVFSYANRKPRLRAVNKTMLRLFGLFNPVLREIVEMHYLWTSPVRLDDRRLRRLLPDLPKTSCEAGIQATLATMRQSGG